MMKRICIAVCVLFSLSACEDPKPPRAKAVSPDGSAAAASENDLEEPGIRRVTERWAITEVRSNARDNSNRSREEPTACAVFATVIPTGEKISHFFVSGNFDGVKCSLARAGDILVVSTTKHLNYGGESVGHYWGEPIYAIERIESGTDCVLARDP